MKKILGAILIGCSIWAETGTITVVGEEIVVTARKVKEPKKEVTSDMVVITKEEIKRMNARFVGDVLKRVFCLSVVQYGGAGKGMSVFLRGGDSNQISVMIDGIKTKSTTLGSFDFSSLLVDDIERIEIIKGPQSTIYGSDAMAGVINIITKNGKEKQGGEISFTGGSFKTYKQSQLFLSGSQGNLDYRLTAIYFKTDGISAAKNGIENDGYENTSFSQKVGLKLKENASLELTGRYCYDLSSLDGWGGRDDPNYTQKGNHYMFSANGKFLLFNNKWEQIFKLSSVHDLLKNEDPDTTRNRSTITTGIKTTEWQNNLYILPKYTLTGGFEWTEEMGKNEGVFDKKIENKALYLNQKIKENNLIVNAGLRQDRHQTFGKETTYKAGMLYNIKEGCSLKTNWATGFRAPTLNDLFYQDSWGSKGNPNLKPEKTFSLDVGVLLKWLSITYFKQDYKDLIQWVRIAPWSWTPQNVAKACIKGIETSFVLKERDFDIGIGYTHLKALDKETNKMLPRRPKDKFNLTASTYKKKYGITAEYVYVGKRYDDRANLKDLHGYCLVNLSGNYNLAERLSIFGRAENLLNDHYEEAKGYGSPGRSFYGGINIGFK